MVTVSIAAVPLGAAEPVVSEARVKVVAINESPAIVAARSVKSKPATVVLEAASPLIPVVTVIPVSEVNRLTPLTDAPV